MHATVRVIPVAWSSHEAEAARQIRIAVFVEEQKVSPELEMDAIDPTAYHVLALGADGMPIGTGRMFADHKDPSCSHIGRMAVLPHARGIGAGREVLIHLIEESRRRGFKKAVLSSQVHAMGFYEKEGFVAFGTEYDDANIPHRDMELKL